MTETPVATLSPSNYLLSKVIGSDGAALNDPTAGVYASKNVGSGNRRLGLRPYA
jgi:hypothetical protein